MTRPSLVTLILTLEAVFLLIISLLLLASIILPASWFSSSPLPAPVHLASGPSITSTPTISPTPSPSPTPTPIPVGDPTKIEIPKLNINTPIVPVGITANYIMDVPKDASQVGYFTGSVKPGQVGGSLLNGHYDTPSGHPAIFYRLKQLKAGDPIVIHTTKNEVFTFSVVEVLTVPYKDYPQELIYGNRNQRELRLITCDGIWNPREKSYSNRLLVFATLSQEVRP